LALSDINHVVERVLALTNHLLSPHRVVLETHLSPDIPQVWIDRHMMEQVLMNLTLNAIQAMKAGGVLTIRTFAREGACVVEVKDTGCGISASVLPRIFDPFFTTKNEGEGTGLGLSVSLGIVERHGGKISVDSEVGRGTKFTVSVPFAKDRYAVGKLS
jgi:signal transduction histidine kinase